MISYITRIETDKYIGMCYILSTYCNDNSYTTRIETDKYIDIYHIFPTCCNANSDLIGIETGYPVLSQCLE